MQGIVHKSIGSHQLPVRDNQPQGIKQKSSQEADGYSGGVVELQLGWEDLLTGQWLVIHSANLDVMEQWQEENYYEEKPE